MTEIPADVEALKAELDRATRERDAAIRRQVYPAGADGDRWYVADQVRCEGDERLGPFASEAEAIKSVLAWIRFSLDPAGVPIPEYRMADEEEEGEAL